VVVVVLVVVVVVVEVVVVFAVVVVVILAVVVVVLVVLVVVVQVKVKGKGTAIPVQALTIPGVDFPRFHDNWRLKMVGPTARPPLPQTKYSWYSFLLEADSNPGP
jgi:hypothetical protein